MQLYNFIFQEDAGVYTQLVREMIASSECRLQVNINDLRKKYPERAARLVPSFAKGLVCYTDN